MITNSIKALIAMIMVSLLGLCGIFSKNSSNTVSMESNSGSVRIGNGTTQKFYSELTQSNDDSLTVTKKDHSSATSNISTKNIELTGTKKRIPLNGAIHTVSIPSSIAKVTIDDYDSYIECDEAVFGSDLEIENMNGTLTCHIRNNTSTQFKGTGGKPLYTIYAKLLNGDLTAEQSSHVKINTPNITSISAKRSSKISANDKVKLNQLSSVSATHSSEINLSSVSVPKLKSYAKRSSTITLAGSAEHHDANIQFSSLLDGSQLKTEVTDIYVYRRSEAKLDVAKLLKGNVSFSSSVRYTGNAQDKVKIAFSSSCKKDH